MYHVCQPRPPLGGLIHVQRLQSVMLKYIHTYALQACCLSVCTHMCAKLHEV